MSKIRFLQFSDLHLGGRAWPTSFHLDRAKAAIRNSEMRRSFSRLLPLIRQESPEVILVPGDLFDRETVDSATVNLVVDTFAAVPEVPVYITPGNHDYLSATSPYAQEDRKRRGLAPWSPNVHIFGSADWSTRYLPENPDVAITGSAFRSNVAQTAHVLAEKIPRDPAAISILMLHGSRTQFDFEESQKITCPFTSQELLAQGFSYAALGHYHTYSEIHDASESIRAAYAGRPFAAEFTRNGKPGGCLCGTITPEGAADCSLLPLDERRLLEVAVVCENVSTPERLQELANLAYDSAGGSDKDLVRFVFTGTHTPGWTVRADLPIKAGFATCVSVQNLRPGYDLSTLLAAAEEEAASIESLFAREIVQRLDASEDEAEKAALQDALDYGLRALRGVEVEVRDAD